MDLNYNFDIVHDVPIEEFHLLKEGMTKLMLLRTACSASVHSKEIAEAFDEAFTKTRVFSETPRRPRRLTHASKFKGNVSVYYE